MHLHAHQNTDPVSRQRAPLLLDVQADLLGDLSTRVVVPLYPAAAHKARALTTLNPVLRVGGKSYVMATQELAGVSKKLLGRAVQDCSASRPAITAALDLLLTGI
ncbi:MAG: CcdB family protein [Gammaproteobacteria bacterium]|nr:CcdB family protein [Gammaproteobacteria bacterium]